MRRAFGFDAAAVAALDKLLHEPARLAVVACLAVVEEADFVFLQSQTGMTGGNLSSHLRKLDEAGYVQIRKEFRGAKPATSLKLTRTGRRALDRYLRTMEELIGTLQ